MKSVKSLDPAIWILDGDRKLFPSLARDGSYRVFMGPKSSDVVPVLERNEFVELVFGQRRAARFVSPEAGAVPNRRSVFDGRSSGWDADPEVLALIRSLLAEGSQFSDRIFPTPQDMVAEMQSEVVSLSSTEREGVVRQRVGQGLFRAALLKLWQGRCAVTGLDIPELLRASHAKPWAKCDNDEERLNPFNGLLLSPHLDALFDCFLLGFDDTGQGVYSPVMTPDALERIGLEIDAPSLRSINQLHLPFLRWHRKQMEVK